MENIISNNKNINIIGKEDQTLLNIKETLKNTLIQTYCIDSNLISLDKIENIAEQILAVHGLNSERLDFVTAFGKFIKNKNQQLSEESVDTNSNKSDINMKTAINETLMINQKLLGYDYLYRILVSLYGKEEAKKITGSLYDFSLAINDSSNILLPYCFSISATILVDNGRDFGQLKSKPCKRVSSYISALCETIHQLANNICGAVTPGTLFLDIAKLMIYKQNISLDELKTNIETRKYLENEFQQLIHSLNSLSRNGAESPFTNVSIFDKEKLAYLIGEKNYAWYYPEKNDKGEIISHEYIIDYIFECQKIFVELFDKGDPCMGGMNYRYPVCTINLSIDENRHIDENNELLNYITNKDISKYNIFVSQGTKLASCCRLTSDAEMLDMAASVNSFGGGNVSVGSHRVCSVALERIAYLCKDWEDYKKKLYEKCVECGKVLKAHKELIIFTEKLGLQPFITNGWLNLNRMFSTFGVLGMVEADKILKKRFDNSFDYCAEIIKLYNEYSLKIGKELGITVNQEEIPAESMAERLPKVDKILFGNPYELDPLLSNQFVPLWEDATVYEKMDRDGELNSLMTGGGIVHIQVDSKVTATQAKNLILYAAKVGCQHFALNCVYTKCNKCNEVVIGRYDCCPKCGSNNIDAYTRVVGFFTRIKDWNKTRKDWEFARRKFTKID